jgi:hypothetical protein
VLHNRHKGGYDREPIFLTKATFRDARLHPKHQKLIKNAKIAKIRGKMPARPIVKQLSRTGIDVSFEFSIWRG